jgi:hypothetical protein
MSFRDSIEDAALPPWSQTKKATTVAIVAGLLALEVFRGSHQARVFWLSVVDRRDNIAAMLAGVHASLLGFAIATFAIILSLKTDDKFSKLSDFREANRQMWTALVGASWATACGAFIAIVTMVAVSKAMENWFAELLTGLMFLSTFYVALSMVDVLAVIQAIVIILRPKTLPQINQKSVQKSAAPAIDLGGHEPD